MSVRARVRLCHLALLAGTLVAWSSATAECLFNLAQTPYHATTTSPQKTAAGSTSHFRTNVDLVLLNVTVLDRRQRAVSDLKAESFKVTEDKRLQAIRFFSTEDEPIALSIVLDASASMASQLEQAKNATRQLIANSNPQDEVHVIVVGDTPRIAVNSSESLDRFRDAMELIQADGQTALWDAMVLGVNELRRSTFQRKAMIVISDGGDNHSRASESELKSILEEADVEVYAIAMFNPYSTRKEEKMGPLQLDEMTSVTGGRVLSVHDEPGIIAAATQISHEMRDQYVIGYYPNSPTQRAKWYRIKIEITGLPTHEKFHLYARKGYYRSAE
jgi:Ca-activated chloride channel homolog